MRWEDNPSQFIQDIAYAYCEHRPLYRPEVTYLKIGLKWVGFTTIIFCVTKSVQFVLGLNYINEFLLSIWSQSIQNILISNNILLAVILISWVIAMRWFLIDCVKIYQHYASDEIRGRCILMPRCSDFAILALRKYGLVLGLYLTYLRIFKRCRGNIYRIEYPSLKH